MNAMDEVMVALVHAKAKHPRFADSDHEALTVLVEEVGEVARAIQADDRANMREELAQVAAVCLRWLEWDKSRQNAPGSTQGDAGICRGGNADKVQQEGSQGQGIGTHDDGGLCQTCRHSRQGNTVCASGVFEYASTTCTRCGAWEPLEGNPAQSEARRDEMEKLLEALSNAGPGAIIQLDKDGKVGVPPGYTPSPAQPSEDGQAPAKEWRGCSTCRHKPSRRPGCPRTGGKFSGVNCPRWEAE